MIALDRIRKDGGWVLFGVLVSAGMLGISAGPALVYQPREMDPSRLEPVKPMRDAEFTKAEFTPADLARVIPNIRITACIFSEEAVRHHVRPAQARFPSCGGKDVQIALADNLIDITVSGMATIEAVDRPFTVTLQHNPPSVTEDGLIVTAIDVGNPLGLD